MGLADLISAQGGVPESETEGPELAAPEKAEASPEELGVEAEETGKPGKVPYARFSEVNVKRKAEAERAAKAEARVKELEEKYGAYSKEFEPLYSKFEKPWDQLKEDAAFAEAWWSLREDPDVQRALAKIQQHHQGRIKVSDRDVKPAAAPAEPQSDPRVEELVRERTRDTVESILKDYNVRGELRGVISAYVLDQKSLKPTREAVTMAIQEFVNGNGWTREFLRGSPGKSRSVALPNPGNLNAGAPAKKDPAPQPDKPKTLSQAEARNRQAFREKLAQRLS